MTLDSIHNSCDVLDIAGMNTNQARECYASARVPLMRNVFAKCLLGTVPSSVQFTTVQYPV